MKGLVWLKLLFSVIGVAALGLSFYLYSDSRALLAEGISAEGEVVKLVRSYSSGSTSTTGGSVSYRPVIVFNDESGQRVEIHSRVGSNPPAYHVGERVEMLYRPGEAHDARIRGFVSLWLGATIAGGLGALFLGVGLSMLVYGRLKAAQSDALRRRGRPIQAIYEGVERNTRIQVNGRHPYIIVAQWQDPVSQTMHLFQSDNFWFNPEEYVQGRSVTVYIDPKDPSKYHMDTSFLPKIAE